MGVYLNPGNSGFSSIRNDTYVDKSGLIRLINQVINTPRRLNCVSRPRRFGKSFAAKMLCAYYDKTCHSEKLFEDLEICKDRTYPDHLNKYDVLYFDMTNVIGEVQAEEVVSFLRRSIIGDIKTAYPDVQIEESLSGTLINAVQTMGNKIIMIIDEWDAPVRELPEIQKDYLSFLRMLFKSSGTTDRIFAAVYMTGILPIKKEGSQSAISDFEEYTMTAPGEFAQYVGFTEAEVHSMCRENADFEKMQQWYNGYLLPDVGSVYNPNSVMKASRSGIFTSYWSQTSATDSLMDYISMDFEGLSKTVAELLGGNEIPVDTSGFANDLVTFGSRDDVLTLLVHLGYLSYNAATGNAHVPNEEIRLEFSKSVKRSTHNETIQRVRESDRLIQDTLHGDEEAVAAAIEKIHMEEAPLFYNSEQTLRSVIKLAYFSYKDYYLKFEELPTGTGYADIVYLPKKTVPLPAILIELKWNRDAQGAIDQIRQRNYPAALAGYVGELLLVGVNYDKNSKRHTCKIEKEFL